MAKEPKQINIEKEQRKDTDSKDIPMFDPIDPITPFHIRFSTKEIIVPPSQVGTLLDLNMNSSVGAGGSIIFKHLDLTSTDATPSVANATVIETAGTTAITDFDDGQVGQIITIKATDSITITDNAAIVLNGDRNFDMSAGDTLTLVMFDDQVWHEVSRGLGSGNTMTKVTADNITLTNGTSSDVVADLQTAHDGNVYHLNEATGAPGMLLEVEFINVTSFDIVCILAAYDGSANHYVSIELYNFNTTSWDVFNNMDTHASVASLETYDFRVFDDTNYIGTGGDLGDVRVRFNHVVSGNASHDMEIDVVALYKDNH